MSTTESGLPERVSAAQTKENCRRLYEPSGETYFQPYPSSNPSYPTGPSTDATLSSEVETEGEK